MLAELVDALFNKQLDEHLDEQLNSNELFDELSELKWTIWWIIIFNIWQTI